MTTVFDVAQYLLERLGQMTTIKLQKLVYYCQAWSLVWDDGPIFPERIEAWANGPVVPELFQKFKGAYYASPEPPIGDPSVLTVVQRETVEAVIRDYGPRDSHWLVELTHLEEPWRAARTRVGALVGQKCTEEITYADMAEYYSGLIN
jgi:uncharacterized phage-associated protein